MARNIQSLERAAAMLRLLAGGERRLGLSDIASTLGLAKGTAHGILRTLQQEGFVEQDENSGRYQLGAELLRLGNSYLDVHELRARALVWTDDPGTLQRRERVPRRAAPAGRAHRPPCLPAGRQPSGAGGRRHAAAALHGPGQGAVRVRPGGAQRGGRGRPGAVHQAHGDRRSGSRASWRSPGRAAGARTWRRPGRVSPRSRPRCTTGGGCRWGRWGSPARWSGCARTGSFVRADRRRTGLRPGGLPGPWRRALLTPPRPGPAPTWTGSLTRTFGQVYGPPSRFHILGVFLHTTLDGLFPVKKTAVHRSALSDT